MANPYALVADIQDAMFLTFSDSTPTVPTEAQVTAMIAEYSDMVDALDQNTTASEASKKNAVVLAVAQVVETRRASEQLDYLSLRSMMLDQLKTEPQPAFNFLDNENEADYFTKIP